MGQQDHFPGLVYVFTGDGKGKTSAALGSAIRALAAGLTVSIIQWYKDPAWKISEHQISGLLTSEAVKRFTLYPLGKGFFIGNTPQTAQVKTAPLVSGQVVVDKASVSEHQQAAASALQKANQLVGQVDVLILDEINNAVSDGLIPVEGVLQLLHRKGKTHLILTGRNAHPAVIEKADLVTSMTKVKHPYDSGKLAIKGLDF